MPKIRVVLAVLLLVPMAATAQRGRSRSGATSRTDMFSDDPAARRGMAVTSGKLRELNPLAILIDKRGDLALSDSQLTQIRTMNDSLEGVDREAFHALDSLNQQLNNLGSDPSPGEQDRAQTMRTLVRMITRTTRERYDAAESKARGLLTGDQKQKADDVLHDAHDDLARLAGRAGR